MNSRSWECYQRGAYEKDPARPCFNSAFRFVVDGERGISADPRVTVLRKDVRDIFNVQCGDELLICVRHAQNHGRRSVNEDFQYLRPALTWFRVFTGRGITHFALVLHRWTCTCGEID